MRNNIISGPNPEGKGRQSLFYLVFAIADATTTTATEIPMDG